MRFIPVYEPDLSGNERKYVLDCVDSGWISSKGEYINKFERLVAEYIGIPHALSVSNGTVAIHLALLALGIGPGDEVIVPDFTYVASVNSILHVGAIPVFVDSNLDDWQITVDDVRAQIGPKTKAILAVHLYGLPCDLNGLRQLADMHNLKLIEDAAEALGSRIDGRHVGTWGDVATFSFFGNKTVTTGEGGLVVTRDDALAKEIGLLKNQYASTEIRYWHEQVGYNYRMTNISAAIGLAQMERIDKILEKKEALAKYYYEKLRDLPISFQHIPNGYLSSNWMCSFLASSKVERDALRTHLENEGIESRPFFFPSHTLPMFKEFVRTGQNFARSRALSDRGINLPSFPTLSEENRDTIVRAIRTFYKAQ